MCRMCIVEIDTGRGPALQPSCMIPVAPDMKVDTRSEVDEEGAGRRPRVPPDQPPARLPGVRQGRRVPAAGPDARPTGPGESRMVEEKRHFEKPIPISDLVHLDRERCILCDRCTRFAKEVAGDPLIHFQDRGNQTQVNTFPDHPFASYFSGNTVQICPVGALTATPLPVQGPALGPRADRVHLHVVLGGLPGRDRLLPQRGAPLQRRRHRPGQLGLAVRQGPLRLRGGPAPRPARHADGAAGRRRRAGRRPLVRRARRGRGRAARRPRAQRSRRAWPCIGGARLTNEAAYAWAKLAKGVIGTDNVDAQLGDGLPADDRARPAPRHDRRGVRARAAPSSLLGPDLKEELPVLFLRLRHAVHRGRRQAGRAVARAQSALDELAVASVRYRPGEAAEVLDALLGDGRAAGRRRRPHTWPGPSTCCASGEFTVILGRASVADTGADLAGAASHHARRPGPGARFLPALRRANVHGALDMGLAPGVLPGRVTPRGRPRLVRDRVGHGARRAGLDCRRHPAGRRRRAHRHARAARRRPARRTSPTATSRSAAWPAPAP